MTRTELIQHIIDKFNYKTYLEIGCEYNVNFDKINIQSKTGVDPVRGGTHRMTSDDFFASNTSMFDIVFIDGLHFSEQVEKDINNSLRFLNSNGTIVMHDCNPPAENTQLRYVVVSAWLGDVWKTFVKQRGLSNIDAATGDFDYGCGVLRVRPNSDLIVVDKDLMTWDNLVVHRQEWLRLMPFQDLMSWI